MPIVTKIFTYLNQQQQHASQLDKLTIQSDTNLNTISEIQRERDELRKVYFTFIYILSI